MKFKGKACYFCGDPATSLEHLPPEQMFAGFSCNKITVPSCDLHNQGKSFFDNCILKGMLWSLHTLREQGIGKELPANVLKAIDQVKDRFPSIKKEIQSGAREVELFQPGEDPLDRNLTAVLVEGHIDLGKWVQKLTAGLVWDATKQIHPELDWYGTATVFENFYLPTTASTPGQNLNNFVTTMRDKEKTVKRLDGFPWVPGWPPGPMPYPADIYSFEFYWSPATSLLYFHHRLFTRFRFWVHIECPKAIADRILLHNRITWAEAAVKYLKSEVKSLERMSGGGELKETA